CRDFFPAKTRRIFNRPIGFKPRRATAICRVGKNANLRAVRLEVRIQRRALPDVCYIERSGEDRLHRRRSRIISEPLDLDIGAETLLKPAFALTRQGVSNYTLGVRDIREMPETNCGFFSSRGKRSKTKNHCSYRCYYLFHNGFGNGRRV